MRSSLLICIHSFISFSLFMATKRFVCFLFSWNHLCNCTKLFSRLPFFMAHHYSPISGTNLRSGTCCVIRNWVEALKYVLNVQNRWHFWVKVFLVWCRLEIESRAWSAPVPFPTLVSPPLSRYMFLRLEFRAIYMPVQWSLEASVAAHAAVCDSAPVCSIFGPCCRGVGPCTSNVATSHINLIRRNYFLLLNCNRLGNSNSNINSIGNSSSRGSANKRVLPQCINLLARACSQVQPQ